MDVVNEILEKSKLEAVSSFLSINVNNKLDVQIDLGSLLVNNGNEFKLKNNDSTLSATIKDWTRNNTQLLINKLWSLPTDKKEDVIVVNLPKPWTVLPRSLPIPRGKMLTKWEAFAKEKGIQKKKQDKLKWDDVLKKWVPLYGFKRAEADQEKNWLIEVPGNADPYEDQFKKKSAEKSERVAKNEFQRLRNLAKSKNIKIPKTGMAPKVKPSANDLGAALTVAKGSTASLGKFQAKLPKEKEAKNVKEMIPGKQKRKHIMLTPKEEREKSLSLVDSILNKKPKIDVDRAVEKEVHNLNDEDNKKKKSHGKKKNKGGGKTKAGAKGGKYRGPQNLKSHKSAMAIGNGKRKGNRVGGKTVGGRKRR